MVFLIIFLVGVGVGSWGYRHFYGVGLLKRAKDELFEQNQELLRKLYKYETGKDAPKAD